MTPTAESFAAGIAALIGAVGVVGILLYSWKRDERRRKRRGEKAPITVKLLRPAGYNLLQRLDKLTEKMVFSLLGLIASGAMFGLTAWTLGHLAWGVLLNRFSWEALWTHTKPGNLLMIPVLLFSSFLGAIYLVHRLWSQREELKAYRLGLGGEQAVADALLDPRVLDVGYRSFHDVPGDGDWNLDHVVIGRGGVFVLETKARTMRPGRANQARHEVDFEGEVLRFPDWDDRETPKQVLRNAEWLRKFLADFGPKELSIHPVIVIPGWFVTSKGNYPVKAMNSIYLPGFVAGMKGRYTPDELKPLFRCMNERCRTLEF